MLSASCVALAQCHWGPHPAVPAVLHAVPAEPAPPAQHAEHVLKPGIGHGAVALAAGQACEGVSAKQRNETMQVRWV